MKKLMFPIPIALFFICAVSSLAAVPHLINYQARLTDKNNTPLEGTYSLTFRIYDAGTSGNLLWEETHSGVVIQKGIFSVLLGSVISLDNLAFDKQYWLEIKVDNEVMSPRQQITSAGYAIRAETSEEAEKLGGKQPADYALANDIASSPTANKAVKLDSNAKLPLSALKVYDSGWFAILTSTTYTKNHNLGTSKCLVTIYVSSSSDGSANTALISPGYYYEPYGSEANIYVCKLTTTQVAIRTSASYMYSFRDENGVMINGNNSGGGYCRIILLALE